MSSYTQKRKARKTIISNLSASSPISSFALSRLEASSNSSMEVDVGGGGAETRAATTRTATPAPSNVVEKTTVTLHIPLDVMKSGWVTKFGGFEDPKSTPATTPTPSSAVATPKKKPLRLTKSTSRPMRSSSTPAAVPGTTNVEQTIPDIPNAAEPGDSKIEDDTLAIRCRHLTGLLLDAQEVVRKQSREMGILKRALMEIETGSGIDLLPPLPPPVSFAPPPETTPSTDHLFQLLADRDATIQSLTSELEDAKAREKDLEDEMEALRLEVDALRGVRDPSLKGIAEKVYGSGGGCWGAHGAARGVGIDTENLSPERDMWSGDHIDGALRNNSLSKEDEKKKRKKDLLAARKERDGLQGKKAASSPKADAPTKKESPPLRRTKEKLDDPATKLYRDATMNFVVTELEQKQDKPMLLDSLRWLDVDRSPPRMPSYDYLNPSPQFHPSQVPEPPKSNLSSPIRLSPHRTCTPSMQITRNIAVSAENEKDASRSATPRPVTRILLLEKERDILEEELVQRYAEIRRLEQWYQDELARRDRELDEIRMRGVGEVMK
ncbi:hypothetical protein HDU97_006363 [Phlyctochytrium planicorne]|nr:hypothetical protein HDU97_006363 [Phlyctochytrium planicorne]